jgi:ubiquinone/menaquinone biosynthesis C-methylase UbiE
MRSVSYLPAVRFHALTRLYDPLVKFTTREAEFRRRLLDQAGLEPGMRVLDLGSGTGTLAVMAKQREPAIEMQGLDADEEMVGRAGRKAGEAGVSAGFDQGLSDSLPYADASFDRVLSSLFFHHLSGEAKRKTLREVARVLALRGELHVADWGKPRDPLMHAAFFTLRLFDGMENTADNAAGRLPELFEDAGLSDAAETERLRTAFGSLCLYRARR